MNKSREILWLIWQDPVKRQRYKIGELYKENEMYYFRYDLEGVKEAKKYNFELLPSFSQLNSTYENDKMFPVFSTRLPDKRRRNIDEILKKYGLERYDAFEFLKKNGGKLPIDTLEFVEPIFLSYDFEKIERKFYVAGTRYYLKESKTNFQDLNIKEGFELKLFQENNNEFDQFAVIVCNDQKIKLGYIPRYFSKTVSMAIEKKYMIECIVDMINLFDFQECLKVKLIIKKVE
ncbi:HIRAN domain-containing protein [Inediibacterium massiliense]|uniref:HIRAN domain-containing protein n=1 Tax=Inediibacterium massiliense TaxID=1658111 RepID=UPI0006B43421|nr:HIRAN domain-containing protein [Inediibacterium massiliense]